MIKIKKNNGTPYIVSDLSRFKKPFGHGTNVLVGTKVGEKETVVPYYGIFIVG